MCRVVAKHTFMKTARIFNSKQNIEYNQLFFVLSYCRIAKNH